LSDTLIATELPAFKHSIKRKPISTSKLYFFDPGVVRHLQQRSGLRPRSPEFGESFETWIAHELRAWLSYVHPDRKLHYWRSASGFEVDFVVDGTLAVEAKAKTNVGERDLRGLRALAEEGIVQHYVVVCLEQRPRRAGNIDILPWTDFLERLWDGAWR
jgi:predicted AAA+ superfamily ATPase